MKGLCKKKDKKKKQEKKQFHPRLNNKSLKKFAVEAVIKFVII